VKIMPATWRDLNALRHLEQACFHLDAWTLMDLIGVLSFPRVVRLKAVDGDLMVGFIAGDERGSKKLAWIATLAVLPDYRRLGIATALLGACEDALTVPRIRLSVRAKNATAINLYRTPERACQECNSHKSLSDNGLSSYWIMAKLLPRRDGCRNFRETTQHLGYNCTMRLDQLPKPIFVDCPEALHRMIDDLAGQSIIAVDTEANSLFAYRERVCLIQFSTSESDYLLDTLALDDLSSLAPIFSNPCIEKVFHAAEYDILILRHDFDFSFARIFDTMVAARILGWDAVGLGALLQSEFSIHANKKYQRANWGMRPLPQDMLTYAQMDTHFLCSNGYTFLDSFAQSAENSPKSQRTLVVGA
jgi:ribosomal protein S18 acetylase RimI-like enzyme